MNIANDNSKANYNVGNEIIYNKEVLKSNFCGYSDAYILVKGNISVTAAPITPANFKNSAPITKCLTKINGATIDDAENLDFVMSVYNLIEYSSNYSEKQNFMVLLNQLILIITFQTLIIISLSSIRLNY